jgi:phage terminase small subunit
MSGNAKRQPVSLQVYKGNTGKLSAEEMAARDDAEITMGDLKFTTPADVKKDKLALKKWREVIGIYKAARLTVVSNTDTGAIARYCILYSEYWQLTEQRRKIAAFDFPDDDSNEILAITDDEYSRARSRRLYNIMEYFTRLDGLLKLDDKINRKLKAILDIEDRIFLNPAAKVRTLPIKRKPKEADGIGDLGFDV